MHLPARSIKVLGETVADGPVESDVIAFGGIPVEGIPDGFRVIVRRGAPNDSSNLEEEETLNEEENPSEGESDGTKNGASNRGRASRAS